MIVLKQFSFKTLSKKLLEYKEPKLYVGNVKSIIISSILEVTQIWKLRNLKFVNLFKK